MMFIKSAPNSHGFVNARDVEDIWRDHFDYFYREYDEFIFVSYGAYVVCVRYLTDIFLSLLPFTLMYRADHMRC
jgi:hypothetical protein